MSKLIDFQCPNCEHVQEGFEGDNPYCGECATLEHIRTCDGEVTPAVVSHAMRPSSAQSRTRSGGGIETDVTFNI